MKLKGIKVDYKDITINYSLLIKLITGKSYRHYIKLQKSWFKQKKKAIRKWVDFFIRAKCTTFHFFFTSIIFSSIFYTDKAWVGYFPCVKTAKRRAVSYVFFLILSTKQKI